MLRASDRTEHQAKASQRLSGPVVGNGAEESVLDIIPLGCSARVMANRNLQVILVGPLLQFSFPESRAMTIAASAVGGDQQLACIGILFSSPSFPPTSDRTHSKLRSVGRRADANMPAFAGYVVYSVGDRSALGIAWKVVDGNLVRLLSPQSSCVFEIADQFGVFSVYADGRQASSSE